MHDVSELVSVIHSLVGGNELARSKTIAPSMEEVPDLWNRPEEIAHLSLASTDTQRFRSSLDSIITYVMTGYGEDRVDMLAEQGMGCNVCGMNLGVCDSAPHTNGFRGFGIYIDHPRRTAVPQNQRDVFYILFMVPRDVWDWIEDSWHLLTQSRNDRQLRARQVSERLDAYEGIAHEEYTIAFMHGRSGINHVSPLRVHHMTYGLHDLAFNVLSTSNWWGTNNSANHIVKPLGMRYRLTMIDTWLSRSPTARASDWWGRMRNIRTTMVMDTIDEVARLPEVSTQGNQLVADIEHDPRECVICLEKSTDEPLEQRVSQMRSDFKTKALGIIRSERM